MLVIEDFCDKKNFWVEKKFSVTQNKVFSGPTKIVKEKKNNKLFRRRKNCEKKGFL